MREEFSLFLFFNYTNGFNLWLLSIELFKIGKLEISFYSLSLFLATTGLMGLRAAKPFIIM